MAARDVLQWSVIQHYEIGLTPLLDLTHSLSVACSFAQEEAAEEVAFVYAFGMPHISNRISVNSEHDIINIRLLSICPPDALRPYFQEGYLVGTWDVTDGYTDKIELDFNRRLMAKFAIPTGASFWGKGFGRIPKKLLYPDQDEVKEICRSISNLEPEGGPRDIGMMLLAWQDLERLAASIVADRTGRMTNSNAAIRALEEWKIIDKPLAYDLNRLRRWRNEVVHGTTPLSEADVGEFRHIARMAYANLRTSVEKYEKSRRTARDS